MNQQTTFPSLGCLTKRTRADRFWEAMNRVVPWSELAAVVAPHCQAAGTGRLLTEVELLLPAALPAVMEKPQRSRRGRRGA